MTKKLKHKIGTHGAVGLVTKQGDICGECGEKIAKPDKSKKDVRAASRSDGEWLNSFRELVYSYNRRTDLKYGKNKIILGVDSRLMKKLEKFISKTLQFQKLRIRKKIEKIQRRGNYECVCNIKLYKL